MVGDLGVLGRLVVCYIMFLQVELVVDVLGGELGGERVCGLERVC